MAALQLNDQLLDQVEGYLRHGATHVFRTMLGLPSSILEILPPRRSDTGFVVGSVGFTGRLSGVVYIGAPECFVTAAATTMLGVDADHLEDDMVNDALAELTNMVVGSIKSRLCDAGLSCSLTIPTVFRGDNIRVQKVSLAAGRSLNMECGGEIIHFELLIRNDS